MCEQPSTPQGSKAQTPTTLSSTPWREAPKISAPNLGVGNYHDVKHVMVREGERFATIAGLQSATDQRILDQSNRLLCPVTGTTIHAAGRQERAALAALSMTLPEPFDVQVPRRVGRDCLVAFEGRQYSVPYHHVGASVDVRGCVRTVEIYRRGDCIARFPRHTDCRLLIDQAHYDGPADARVAAPSPLGRMARQMV